MGSDLLFELGGVWRLKSRLGEPGGRGRGGELVEEGGDCLDGFLAFLVGPGLPAGASFGGIYFEFFFDLGSELHHFHEEVVGEGFIFWRRAIEKMEHEIGS